MDLRTGLEGLPQELYDVIYNMVFEVPSGIRDLRCTLSRDTGLPPNQRIGLPREILKLLSIDRASRALSAKSYFSASLIVDDGWDLWRWVQHKDDDIYDFFYDLDVKHRAFITCFLRVDNNPSDGLVTVETWIPNLANDKATSIKEGMPALV